MSTTTIPKTASSASFWQAALMITGTCIGGGMLALPVQTANSGFWLSILNLVISWAFMAYTGLLLVEATLWVKKESHFSSLSRFLLGHGAKILSILAYLFMNYASLVAYVSGGAMLFKQAIWQMSSLTISYELGCVLFSLAFGLVLFLGWQMVSRLNFGFVILMAVSYLVLVAFGLGSIQVGHLAWQAAYKQTFHALPLILATFSYQMVVPSVCSMLNYDARSLKKAILYGTGIPCIIYLVWLLVVHGVVPYEGAHGLKQAWLNGQSATMSLSHKLGSKALAALSDLFGFLAVVTSYLGLSVALFDFLKDCFKELKVNLSHNLVLVLTLVPALILAIFFPKALISCLDISGGYGDTILAGLIPVAMVYVGRYKKGLVGDYTAPFGKGALYAAALFYLVILIHEISKVF